MKRLGKFVCVLTLVLAAKSVAAQEIAGSIRGTVVDGSGGTVSGVKVTATQSETGLKRSTMSDAQGTYILVELPVGHYLVEAEAPGFKKYIQGGISRDVNQTAAVTIRLAVGLPTQEVQVNTNASLVEPTVTSLGKTVAWQDPDNLTDNVLYADPKSAEERIGMGQLCVAKLGIKFPAAVDGLDNSTKSVRPRPLFVSNLAISPHHVEPLGPGRVGTFRPKEVADVLKRLVPAELK